MNKDPQKPTSKPDFEHMSYEDIIQFCIGLEEESELFYQALMEEATDRAVRLLYQGLAGMERGHRRKLEQLDEDKFFETAPTKVIDLKITDYLLDAKPGEKLSTQDALILAAKREKATRDLYEILAGKYTDEPFLQQFFTMMAEEEARHKHILESEYEQGMLGEF